MKPQLNNMENVNLKMLIDFPCLERDPAGNFKGKIRAGNLDHDVHIIHDENGYYRHAANSEIAPHKNIIVLLNETRQFLEAGSKPSKICTETYRKVLHEYSEFSNFHVNVKSCRLSNDLTHIDIESSDEGNRTHRLHIQVNYLDSTRPLFSCTAELPVEFTPGESLIGIYDDFLATIERLQGFFDVMDALDESACVLDPERPTRVHKHRRIYLDQNLSVVATFDPVDINSRPDLKFLGPERVVERYRERLNSQLETWELNHGVITGILNILEMEHFPEKPEKDTEVLMEQGDCSICFSLRCNEKLPEIICENKCCENFYHTECLYEWLASTNSKRIFNQIHGLCPNCEKAISCPLPDMNDT